MQWAPNPGPQTEFLSSSVYEVLYGGAAGGGKSEAMVMDPLRYINVPTYQFILFRRTFPELHKSLIERSQRYYGAAFPDASYNDSKHVWRFGSGSLGWFGHLEHDTSVYQHQSAEYQYIGFEELTHFTEFQYKYLLSRGRGSNGVPVRIRANTNPGGDGHLWVQRRWAPWLGPPPEDEKDYRGPRALPGEVLWYVNLPRGEGEKFVSKDEAQAINAAWEAAPIEERMSKPLALTRTFIPARLRDNPKLDPTYGAKLAALDLVSYSQLAEGDWNIRPAPGLYFKRTWFNFVDEAPSGVRRIRYWDLAGTEKDERNKKDKKDPDWTVGLLLSLNPKGQIFVEHVMRFRGDPHEVESTILATAEIDGREVEIGLPQDPGQAGKFQASYFVSKLQGFVVHALPETGDKITRARPISAQAKGRNVHLVRGRYIEPFVRELEEFPGPGHDDQVDAFSGAYARLVGSPPPTYAGLPPVVGKFGGRGR